MIKFKLPDLTSAAGVLGKQAQLYCGACQTVIPFGQVTEGPIQDWPYCPVHNHRPLVVRPASLSIRPGYARSVA